MLSELHSCWGRREKAGLVLKEMTTAGEKVVKGRITCVVSGVTGTQKGWAQLLELPGDFPPRGDGFERRQRC